MSSTPPFASEEAVAVLNATRGGWAMANDLRYLSAQPDELVLEMPIAAQHLQPYGIVHGGVYCALVETAASVGAGLTVVPQGKACVGLENHTSFLKAVREGVLRAVGRPLAKGRTTHTWEVEITDSSGRMVATGRVRLLVIDPASGIAGQTIPLPWTGGG